MRTTRFTLTVAAVAASLAAASAAQFKFPTQTLTVPDGFEVELAAGPGLANRPIEADFDEQGRLYVTDSSGSNDKVDKQLQEKPHQILRLEDTDGDGRFDKSSIFADKMMFPEGSLWHDGSLYVSAPPSIWKLTDTDGDGVADKREEWFQGKTLTGCANDLHGPYAGPDGWIYWCKGAFAKQTYERPGKAPFETRAAHIFRCRPDGSGLEPVMTGGMDNPVEVAFTSGGERIFTTTFFQNPGGGRRDGLVHAVYGGVYGKVNDVTDDHKKTGELMPVLTHLGPAAPCGLLRYESASFGPEYQNSLFACLFNLHKVTRHVLEPDGATFRTKDSDFLVSDNTDFHPTDVIEDADGSLLVVDTGGWYKLCCPTSQLWKPDVLGAIYRIRRTGAPKIADPRGLKLKWANVKPEELAKRLSDPRVAVRKRATALLSKQGEKAVAPVAALLKESSKKIKERSLDVTLTELPATDTRRAAVWALTQIDSPKAREAVRVAFNDGDASVRQAAIHSASVWRDAGAVTSLIGSLKNDNLQTRRAAAEALGRIGDKAAVPAILAAASELPLDLEKASQPAYRVLEHSLIYALIEIGDPGNMEMRLNLIRPLGSKVTERSANAAERRAVLIALDQMDGGKLKADDAARLLNSPDALLKQAANWVVSHHPEWGATLAGFFRERIAAAQLSDADRKELQNQLGQFAGDAAIQELLSKTAGDASAAPQARLTSLKAMAQSGLKEVPSHWSAVLAGIIAGNDKDLMPPAVQAAHALSSSKGGSGELTSALTRVAGDNGAAANIRLEALAAVPGGLKVIPADLFEFVRSNVDLSKPVGIRAAAANILAKAKLSAEQLAALTGTIKDVGPLEISRLLPAFENGSTEELGLKLVAALKESKGASGVRGESLKPVLAKYPAPVQQQGEALLASLNVDSAKQKAHLDEIAASLKDGDIRRGQAVFNSAKAACSSCHSIGYLGGNLGPDLTRVGQVRNERDLLEAVVYPSASFVRSFEPMVVVTKSGEDFSGVLRKDGADEVVLGTGPGTDVRIARADIVEMRPGTVSVMPQGLDEQLSRQELADLITFLRATRW